MAVTPRDELRHDPSSVPDWRESVYFNLADSSNELGAWIYLWLLPNQPRKSGLFVGFYHGTTAQPDAIGAAMGSTDHVLRGNGDSWAYAFHMTVAELVEADFDDIALCGLSLRRVGPLDGYQITYSDDAGTRADLRYDFTSAPWDYGSADPPCPKWFADNRYHRSAAVSGTVEVAGACFAVQTTGDSDHSWGPRDNREVGARVSRYWAMQSADGDLAMSVLSLRRGDEQIDLGFVQLEGEPRAIRAVHDDVTVGDDGVQRDIRLWIEDDGGRHVRAEMEQPFAALAFGRRERGAWGYEAVGSYEVIDHRACTGVASYGWPATTPTVT